MSQFSMYPVAPPFDVVYKNASAPYPVGPHSHNAAELYFTLTDLPDVLLNDTVSAVPAGTLLIIPTFCVHQLYHESGIVYERYILSINTNWLKGALCDGAAVFSFLENTASPLLFTPTETQKQELILQLEDLLKYQDRATPEALASFFRFLSALQEHTSGLPLKECSRLPISPSQKKVNEVISYLQEHLSENVTIQDLADHFYLNPDYLARLFKSHMHVSLGHYAVLQKISAAEGLLREGKTVTEVQEALGFSSYAYFFKAFQRSTGISPSQYRNKYQHSARLKQ